MTEGAVTATFPERLGQKPCRACGALIPTPARKCTIRSSSQDWRRLIPFDATILALLTALVSVLATLAPNFIKWFEGGVSNLTIDYDRDSQGAVVLTAYNSGNVPAHIREVILEIPLKSTPEALKFVGHPVYIAGHAIKNEDEDYFIAPNTHKFIKITFDIAGVPPNLSEDAFKGSCLLHFETDKFYPIGLKKSWFDSWFEEQTPADISAKCTNISVVTGKNS